MGWRLETSYLDLPAMFYSEMEPKLVGNPQLVLFNDALAEELGLHPAALKTKRGLAILGGIEVPHNTVPLAQAYAGHQFGNFTMLGDGRAMLIGEQITPSDERVDIQLKGSGPTPYSRRGDGRAALGPMLREYLISEAMHGLGIPTTRSLAVVTTGETILREEMLEGAILTRVASSHLRFGTFQYAANWGTEEDLQALADYTIERHYSDLKNSENPYLALLNEVIKKQATLVAKWQRVGFVHGVLNTDNMTISGETIDYGPCAFLDEYAPATTFSSIDTQGRYAYANQPAMIGWNLTRFAETLLPLLHKDESEAIQLAQTALSNYPEHYQKNWLSGMRLKLGLRQPSEIDESLITDLLKLMDKYEADYTNTFIALSLNHFEGEVLFEAKEFQVWKKAWENRLEEQGEAKEVVLKLMQENNPAIIPRNYYVEQALQAAKEGDLLPLKEFLQALSNPYAHTAAQKKYANPPKLEGPYQTYCGT